MNEVGTHLLLQRRDHRQLEMEWTLRYVGLRPHLAGVRLGVGGRAGVALSSPLLRQTRNCPLTTKARENVCKLFQSSDIISH
jgi:hypothetical protein